MINLGKKQELIIKRITEKGAYLNFKNNKEKDILLPREELDRQLKTGDKLEVMIYKDSSDKILATRKKPYGEVGDIVKLKVISKLKFGAFLDMGLDKDVFLPFSETIGSIREGQEVLVSLYVDKSDRICASMQLDKFLDTNSPYKVSDKVKGTIYSINNKIGAFVAIDNKYSGLIPKSELIGAYKIGDIIEARISNIKPDGKLDLSLKGKSQLDIAVDVNKILDKLKSNGGYLPYNDKSSPEEIRKEFNMSKSSFKRAIGSLYKERMILFKNNGIYMI